MTRFGVVVGDRPDQVDRALLAMRLGQWSEGSGIEVDLVADAGAAVDGLLIDAELAASEAAVVPDSIPAVYVDVTNAGPGQPGRLARRLLYGRGIDTYVWAAKHLSASLRSRPATIRYGDDPDQFGELHLPDGDGPHPVVVLIHGGFWHRQWECDLMDALAIDVAAAGLAAWNIEYRRGPGSWAAALDDVGLAIDALVRLAGDHRLDPARVAVVGHSAGGHLALWAAGRRRHGAGAALEPAIVEPVLVVPLAPVADLVECADRNLGEGACVEFFGGSPDEVPERYARADPMQRLPTGIATAIVQGLADSPDLVDLNRRYAARALAAGDQVELIELDATDHFHVIDPATPAWARVRGILDGALRAKR
jgi:acetyl esterase/lipase